MSTNLPGPYGQLIDPVTGLVAGFLDSQGREQPTPQSGASQNQKKNVNYTFQASDWGSVVYLVAQAADKTFTVPAGLPQGWWALAVYRNSNSAAGRLKIANDGVSVIEWNNAGTFAQTSPLFVSAANVSMAAALIVSEGKPMDAYAVFPLGGVLTTS